MIKRLYELVTTIQGTSGTNDKLSILLANKDDNEFKRLLKYVYDPMMIYGVQKKKLDKHAETVCNLVHFTDFFQVFEYLLLHNTGKDSDVKIVSDYINQQDEEYREFLTECFTKKLKLGINSNSINKVFPNLIPIFGLMKAKSYHMHKKHIKGKDYILSEKKNGIRGSVINRNGVIEVRSRQGKLIEGLNGIVSESNGLKVNHVYEGELVIKNSHLYKHREVLQKTMEIVNSDSKDKVVDFWLFDHLPLDDFEKGEGKTTYFNRRNELELSELNHIKWIPELYRGNDESKIEEYMEWTDENGLEGLMLNLDTVYVKSKTNNILKIKPIFTSDLRYIGYNVAESGQHKGKLASIILEYKGFKVSCSGMNMKDRNDIWENRDNYIGRIAEIEHQQESSNAKGGLSLEYPQFIRWRTDKNEVSYAHE